MMFILGLLPILQAVAACFTIWGVAHSVNTTDTVVQYGVGADGPTAEEWFNSFGSLALGIVGFVTTTIMKRKTGANSELMTAFAQWTIKRDDPASMRRLAFALTDWIEEVYVSKVTDSDDKDWWNQMLTAFRTRFAGPVVYIAPADSTQVSKP